MGLQWDDVDLETRRILVQRAVYEGKSGPTKTGESELFVDISEELALALDQLRDEQTDKSGAEWIFSSSRFPEQPASYLFWLKHLTAATRKLKLGMKVTPHLFRHTYASQLLQAGVQITYVAAQLGHARVSMTRSTSTRTSCRPTTPPRSTCSTAARVTPGTPWPLFP